MKTVVTLVLLFLATAAPAATITAGARPGPGTRLALSADDFAARGPCGTGLSVVHGGCTAILADATSKPAAHGPHDPLGGPWIDSQDLSEVAWTVIITGPSPASPSRSPMPSTRTRATGWAPASSASPWATPTGPSTRRRRTAPSTGSRCASTPP